MRQITLSSALPIALILTGCSNSNNVPSSADASGDGGGNAAPDASTVEMPDGTTPDAGTGSSDAAVGSPDTGSGRDAGTASLGTLSFVAKFSESAHQLPEGLWATNAGAGTPIVGWAPLATLITGPAADGGTLTPLGSAAGTFTFGITSDPAGSLYVGVGAASAVGDGTTSPASSTPAPGIYQVPADGGAPSLFSPGASPSPQMNAANGLVFVGPNLFVADSEGVIYEIGPGGTASVWSSDSSLAPASASAPGCATDAGPIVPLAIGANGIAVDAAQSNLYVTNTDFGRVLKFPITSTGAGPESTIVEDCSLAGADGIQVASDGSLIVAVNAQNKIVRVTTGGELTVLAEGGPLQTPASIIIQGSQLLITNSTFFYAPPDGGTPAEPGLLTGTLTLP
jgi:SMP-30/Gluconolactonase/LRE-like region